MLHHFLFNYFSNIYYNNIIYFIRVNQTFVFVKVFIKIYKNKVLFNVQELSISL